MASTHLYGKLQSDPWKISLVAGLLWVEITRVWHCTLTRETSADLAATAPISPLGWERPGGTSTISEAPRQSSCSAQDLPQVLCHGWVNSGDLLRSAVHPHQGENTNHGKAFSSIFPPLLMLSHQRYFHRPFHLSSQSEDTWTVHGHKEGLVHEAPCWGTSLLFGKPRYDAASFLQLWDKSLTRV